METVDVLRVARAKIEQGWCQYSAAKNSAGEPTPTYESDAVCWCALGAIAKVEAVPFSCVFDSLAADLLREVLSLETSDGVSAWNDHPGRTKEEVLSAFDRAIELAEQERAGGAA